jgi:hypothetical protein
VIDALHHASFGPNKTEAVLQNTTAPIESRTILVLNTIRSSPTSPPSPITSRSAWRTWTTIALSMPRLMWINRAQGGRTGLDFRQWAVG